ncbi:type IX secretion system membrane protein PorP/SprF [Winogradskyella sp. A3E31]|uniref:PorP/SprF family type IX secretion system membrane protein n=1 Tax=Winogradskyella sp. A3E31 TaxID=3349637 RepID=UPI00398A5959
MLWRCFIFILLPLAVFGQQDPQYTNYMYAMQVVNPAYVGLNESLSVGVLYRNQWTGFDGAPETGTLFGHSPLSSKISVGLSVIADQIGPVKETNLYTDLSYTIELNETHNLAFGIKAGATFHNIGTNTLTVFDPNDPFFNERVNSTTPNFGAGLFFYSDNYYAGFSIPNFLNAVHLNANNNRLGTETQHFFFTGGYVFSLSETVKLKPSFLVKSAFEASTSFDLNLNTLLYDTLELGASYRYDDSFSALVNFAVQPNLKIGYAYDAIVSDIQPFAPSSHEVFILYQFDTSDDRRIKSPRFF